MNPRRFATICRHELRTQLGGALFWVLLLLIVLITSALNPVAMIPSGETSVGGVRAQINSAHALAQTFALSAFFVYPFLAALMAGLAVIRDDEAAIADLLHSTPLTPAEYIVGKLAGVMAALGVALLLHVLLAIGVYELGGFGGDAARGPFLPGVYLGTALLFAAPGIWFSAAMAFVVGEWTRRPMAVYAVPTALFVLTIALLWTWAPAWLPGSADRLLMIVDPSTLRWLGRTLFAADRGMEFYNVAPLALDATLLLNRCLTLLVPGLAVVASVRHFHRSLGGAPLASGTGVHRADAGRILAAPDATPSRTLAASSFRPLGALGMCSRAPGLFSGAGSIIRSELRDLLRQPALYLFALFLATVVMEIGVTETDGYGAPVLLTAGTLAVRAIPVVTLLVCLYLLFVVVEGMHRETATGFDTILYASPVPTAAIFLGKGAASALVIAALTGTCIGGSALVLALQSGGRLDWWPLVLVFGLVLGPTFLLWTAFVTAVMAVVRERATALGVGLLALVLTGAHFVSGSMTWVTNWALWGALRWSDMGTFPLNGPALLLNRFLALVFTTFFATVALTFFRRTERDATAMIHRISARHLARSALRLAPFALMPLLIGGFLGIQVRDGFEGGPARQRAESYGSDNVAAWRPVEPPRLTHIEVALDLEPAERGMRVAGTYRLVNGTVAPMPVLPITVGGAFEGVRWSIRGVAVPSEDRAGLHLVALPTPLLPGDTLNLGFSYHATYPRGVSRNGGGAATFILPAGVLLATNRGEFLPVPGFVDSRAVMASATNALSHGDVGAGGYTMRLAVSAPADYTVNATGTKAGETTRDARTTTVWESDRPVAGVNVVAGRWSVRARDGVAVYFHPGHHANVDQMLGTLVAARARYSEWFHPYPWHELRLSEFPDLETNATAYPANISFSEGIGFLAGNDPESGLGFSVTAHEAAHQWWGHLVTAGDGPGTDLLIEGMANFSALLLHEVERGLASRIAFTRQLERHYLGQRRRSTERALLETVERSASDAAVLSQKGAVVLWMLDGELGRDRMLRGLKAFVDDHVRRGVQATPQSLLEALGAHAGDPDAFQSFVDQWMRDVVLPEYQLSDASMTRGQDGWRVEVTVMNAGTGTASVALAASRGVRFADPDEDTSAYVEQRQVARLGAGESVRLTWTLDFRPERIVVDPDAMVLQFNRERAFVDLGVGPRGAFGRE